MKKVLSLVLVLTLVLGSFSFAFADTANPTDNERVNKLIELGLVFGDAGGYRLNDTITRAEAAAMVARALDLEQVAQASKYASSFSDVPATHWALGYINVAAGRGIVKGYPNGTFQPDANISYAEIITMMVQVLGGLNEQEAKAPWPGNMITKASTLGILKDVSIANFGEVAIRERVFEVVYNTITSQTAGNYQVVKAIVLENYRVESIDKNDVVVEVIREVQKGNFTAVSRTEKGDQIRVSLPANVGDVENLLGKVVDLSFDKTGKVVKAELDNTYKYVVGNITGTDSKSITLDYTDKYTVQLDERYDKTDERMFRTYFNNDSMKYENFYKDVKKAEFARVTIKNGKVLFIDAFQFDDIAPVKEVKEDGKVVYIYDDVRDGSVRKLEFDSKTKVISIKDKEMKLASLEDISAMDVIHYVDNTVFVRQDADVEGKYEKYTTAKIDDQDTAKIFVDGKGYTAGFGARRTAVFSTDGEAFITLERGKVSDNLEKIRNEEVTILLDMNNRVQYIASGIKDPSFIALFEQTNKGDARFVKSDNTKDVYSSTFDTKYVNVGGSTKLHNLYDLNVGDLVKVKAVDTDIARLELLRTRDFMVTNSKNVVKMTKDEIQLDGATKFFVEPSTKVFINVYNSTTKAYTLKGITVAELLKNYTVNQNTTTLKWNSSVFVEKNADNAKVADILVFTALTDADVLRDTYVRKVVEIEGHDLYTYYMVLADTSGTKTTHYVDKDDAIGIKAGDIIKVELTRDDDKEVYAAPEVLVKWNAPVYKITKIDGRTYQLEDKHGVKETRYLLSSASVFGEPGVDEYVAIPASNNGDAINVIVEKTAAAGLSSAPYGEWKEEQQGDKESKVTYTIGDAAAKVTLPKDANVAEYAVLVTGDKAGTGVTDEVATIKADGYVNFTFSNNSMYTVKLVKLSAPTTVINSATFITNITPQNVTTIKSVDANVATVNNTTFAISAEYNTTAAQLLAALEPTQAGATLKVLSGTAGYEVAGTVKVTNAMKVEVTAKDGTTKKEYALTVKTGTDTTLSVIDANVASLAGTALTVDQGTTVAQILAAIKLGDNKATVKALASNVAGAAELAANHELVAGNILRVTAQDGTTTADYTFTITPVVLSNVTTLKSLDLNKVTVVNTSGSEAITIVDTDAVETAADLLALIQTIDANATVKVLGATSGVEVPASFTLVPGTTVVEVTAEDGVTVVEYSIN